MNVIPAINEVSFFEVEKKIKQAADFGAVWVHLDVSDGKFTANQLWNNPKDLRELGIRNKELRIKFEVHLMVENPDEVFEDWIDAGAKRIIVHLESVKDIESMIEKCELLNAELFLAINPDTPADKLFEYENRSDGFLILAVAPGRAGQKFREDQLEKIRTLRQRFPDAKIIVDGGVNLENAPHMKSAGADMLVAASAIWGIGNPADNFRKLQSI